MVGLLKRSTQGVVRATRLRRWRRAEQGFTLIELMITVTVLAILIALAFPNLSDTLRRRRVVAAGEALSSQLQFARSEAVKQNKEVAVNITTAAPWGLEVDGVKLLSGNDYPGTALTASDATIVFEGVRGMIKLGGKEAANDTSATMTITLDSYQIEAHVGVMGRVLLCSPEGKSVGGYGKC